MSTGLGGGGVVGPTLLGGSVSPFLVLLGSVSFGHG